MGTVSVSAIQALLTDGQAWAAYAPAGANHTRPEGAPWGAWSTAARIQRAGTSADALEGAGFRIQSETLGAWRKVSASMDAATATASLKLYVDAGHRTGPDHRVSAGLPSAGLRPSTVPASWSAGTVKLWAHAMRTLVAELSPGAPICNADVVRAMERADIVATVPDGALDGTDQHKEPRTRAKGGVPVVIGGAASSFAVFQSCIAHLSSALASLGNALGNADDVAGITPHADAYATWSSAAPLAELAKVPAVMFDSNALRPGAVVEFVDGNSAHAAAFRFKRGMPKGAELGRFVLEATPDGVAWELRDGDTLCTSLRGGALLVPAGALRRYHAPRPVPAVAWKATVDTLATYLSAEVLVLAINGDSATIMDAEGNDAEVPITELSAPV